MFFYVSQPHLYYQRWPLCAVKASPYLPSHNVRHSTREFCHPRTSKLSDHSILTFQDAVCENQPHPDCQCQPRSPARNSPFVLFQHLRPSVREFGQTMKGKSQIIQSWHSKRMLLVKANLVCAVDVSPSVQQYLHRVFIPTLWCQAKGCHTIIWE